MQDIEYGEQTEYEYRRLDYQYECAKMDYKICLWISALLLSTTCLVMGSVITGLYDNDSSDCESLRKECDSYCDLTKCTTCQHCNITCNIDICDNGCIHHKAEICKGKICPALPECVNCENVYSYKLCNSAIITYHNGVALLVVSIIIISLFFIFSWYERYPFRKRYLQ